MSLNKLLCIHCGQSCPNINLFGTQKSCYLQNLFRYVQNLFVSVHKFICFVNYTLLCIHCNRSCTSINMFGTQNNSSCGTIVCHAEMYFTNMSCQLVVSLITIIIIIVIIMKFKHHMKYDKLILNRTKCILHITK